MMKDIPLKDCMIAWNDLRRTHLPSETLGKFAVGPRPEKPNSPTYGLRSWLSFNREEIKPCHLDELGRHVTDEDVGRMLRMFIELWHVACRDGVPLKNIHEAMMAVPEYRITLSSDFAMLNREETPA